MIANVIGATGATGRALVKQLIDDPAYTEVRIFVRKPAGFTSGKVQEFVVDFERSEEWRKEIQGDVAISVLGTTLKDAGSQAAQFRVDHDYQLEFAEHAYLQGVPRFVLLSAYGASMFSPFFYSKMKGYLEEAVSRIPFESAVIVRPGFLVRPNTTRLSEKLALPAVQLASVAFSQMKPLPVEKLASALANLGKLKSRGLLLAELRDIEKFS